MSDLNKIEDEIKFKELLKNPLRLFGWIYPYFFVLLLVFGIFFGHQLITISFNEQNVSAIDSTNIKKEIIEKAGGIIPAVDLATIKNPTKEMLANGKKIYDANCKSCHGDTGLGDGPAGVVLNPKPRNFHQTDGWTNGRNLDQLYKTLQEGIISKGMAAYEYLSPSDRFDIIYHFRTFASFPQITDDQINSLNTTYNLTAGTVKPNQISVNKAEVKLIDENSDINLKAKTIVDRVNKLSESVELSLLRSNVRDMNRVVYSFTASKEKSSFENFSASVIKDVINSGFKPSVLALNQNEWKAIYNLLDSISK